MKKTAFAIIVAVTMAAGPAFAAGLLNPSAEATAVAVSGAEAKATNTNVIMNSVDVRNSVDVKNANSQSQSQSQNQGQSQSSQISNNNGQTIAPQQNVTFVNPENKRDLPGIPGYAVTGAGEYRGPYEKGNAGKVKPWALKTSWTWDQVWAFYSMTDSAECRVFKFRSASSTENLKVGTSTAEPLAYLECRSESDLQLWGTVAKIAMRSGAQTIEEVAYTVTFANKSTGWNVGFGGGVSAINGGNDNYGGAVGGGTGYGSVTVRPVQFINAIFLAR